MDFVGPTWGYLVNKLIETEEEGHPHQEPHQDLIPSELNSLIGACYIEISDDKDQNNYFIPHEGRKICNDQPMNYTDYTFTSTVYQPKLSFDFNGVAKIGSTKATEMMLVQTIRYKFFQTSVACNCK